MKYFSLFSGIGGFEYGILNASQTSWLQQGGHLENMSNPERPKFPPEPFCVGFSEIDKYAIQIYKKHYPSHKEYGNVTNIKCSDVPDFDLLCGGFPCQSFSIAGKRGGFGDTRGTLFFEIARIAQEKQPRLLLLENVKGLLSHDKGRTFGTILNMLDELGYDLQWQVLNSKNFGVPQNRERVFIIGHLRTTSRPQIFPLRQNDGIYFEERSRPLPTLTTTDYKGPSKQRASIIVAHPQIQSNEPSPRPPGDKSDRSNSIRRVTYSDDMRIRRLTPTECERLQGFPDGWTEKGLTNVQICGNIKYIDRKYICDRFVELRNAIENLYQGKMESVSCIIKDLNGEEQQINISPQRKNVNTVDEMLLREISVSDTINLGNGTGTLCSLKGTYNNVEQIKKNLTQGKMGNPSILPVWKIYLKESWNQKRLSTISTWIKEITKNPIFTYVKTDEPITDVIIHWNWLQPNYIREASFDLEMGNIISVSDTQRYKCLGNAVTTNVISAIMEKLLDFPHRIR